MDFLQGKRMLTAAAVESEASATSPVFSRGPVLSMSPTKGAAPTSPPQNAFKKRRKAQDRFFLSPLRDSASTPGLAIVTSKSSASPLGHDTQRAEDSHTTDPVDNFPTRDTIDDVTPGTALSTPASPFRKSKSDVRLRSSKSRDPLVPRALPSRMSTDSPPKKCRSDRDPLQPLPFEPCSSMEVPAPMEALQRSLFSTFWSRHMTPATPHSSLGATSQEPTGPPATGGIQLDQDIRAYCQRGPVSHLSRAAGRTWLTNMLRAYDIPSSVSKDETDTAERQLQLVIAQAQAHFHPGETTHDAFLTALLNAVANDIWDTCTHDFVHTVAGHYRDLLTNLPTLLKEREAKLEAAHATIRRLENEQDALKGHAEALGRGNAELQTRINHAEAKAIAQHDTIQDMEAVLRDAVATELAATSLAKQLELQVREVENALDLKTQAYDQLTGELQEMSQRCLDLERTVLDTKQLHADALQDRDAGLIQIKELAAKSAQLGRDVVALTNKLSDMHVEQQVLHLRLNAESTQHEHPRQASLRLSSASIPNGMAGDFATAALHERIEQLQEQVFRQSIDLANREKAFRAAQTEQDHKDQLLKRLDAMVEATKAENAALQTAHDTLLAQRDTLKLRLDIVRADDTHDELKQQVQQLVADKVHILEDLARIVLERDVAVDDLARARRKLDHIRRHLPTVMVEVKRLHASHASLRVAVAKQMQGSLKHLSSVTMSVNSTMAKVVGREARLSDDILNMQRGAVNGDPVFRYTLQLFQKQLRRIRSSWADLRQQSASEIDVLATYHFENTQHLQRLAKHAHDKLTHLQKPKPKKQPLISIPSTKSMKQLGVVAPKQTTANSAHSSNATTQTTAEVEQSQGTTNDVVEQLTSVLLPVLEATETKLMAVMDKVERQKMDLLAAYQREAELRNRLDNPTAPPLSLGQAPDQIHPPSNEEPVREGTPDTIVHVRDQLLAMTTGDKNANLVLHVADLYNMLHTNLSVLEAALDDGPVLYVERRDSHGNIVTDAFDPSEQSRQNNVSTLPGRRLFKPSKTSSRTLFPIVKDAPPNDDVVSGASSSTLNISVHDGEIQNLPPAVHKRIKSAVLKLAAAALFQDAISVNDLASLLIAGDPDVDVATHGVEDIRDDQLIQNNLDSFSLGTSGSNHTHDGSKGGPSHHDKTRSGNGDDHAVPVVKVVTRLLDLVGVDLYASEKKAGDVAPHTKTWLLKQIRSIYHDKYIAESLEHAAFHAVLALPEFIVQWAFLKFGVKEVVAKNCHAILDGTNEWKGSTPEIHLFAAFLAEQGKAGFGKSDLSLFLHARQLVVDFVGDMRQLSHEDVPHLTSTQALRIVLRVFQTLVQTHRHFVLAKLETLLQPSRRLNRADETVPVDQEHLQHDTPSSAQVTLPCFDFQGLPEPSSTSASGQFPEGKPKKAIPSHAPDPKLILESALDSFHPPEEDKWIDVHQLLLFCVLEFREERRRFFTDMQAYVANRKVREDVPKATFQDMMYTLFEWTPSICELVFEEASHHGMKKTVDSDGTVLVDCQHLMCVALQYYTNLFALARFISVDETEDGVTTTETSFTLQAAPRFRHREVSRVCQ